MGEGSGKKEKTGPTIGDAMPDGTIYAGESPESGKAMFTTAADVPATCSFDHAQDYAAKLDAHGYRDWRVPTRDELNVLFQNRAAIGGFDESCSYPGGWYWSSSQYDYNTAWGQRFCDGKQFYLNLKNTDSSVRCVR
jgi:hypothetical protein